MSLNLFWFLPTHGDGHYLGTEEGSRPVDHGYLQQIAQAADRIGFTGVLTFKNAKKALKALAEVPEDKLVLETDCPYMAPVPFRGKRCDSRMIPYTAEAAALVRGTDTQTILEQTCRNGERLFNI